MIWPATVRAFSAEPGDLDGNDLVELADFALFHDCADGPGSVSTGVSCPCADFDSDGDVDLHDVGAFQRCFGADYRPPGCSPQWATGFHLAGVGAQTLAVFDDGNGPALFVGGSFERAWDIKAIGIARWDGYTWSDLGGLGPYNPMIEEWPFASAMIVFGDGGGPALYVAGCFETVGGVAANSIARWDGSSWSPLGRGILSREMSVSCPFYPWAVALAVFDDGNGPALYAAGDFYFAGDVPVHGIAKWDGHTWSDVGGGIEGPRYAFIGALAVFDDGAGPALYAGGLFTSAGGVEVTNIAKWDGTAWASVGGGVDGPVRSLAVFDAGNGSALYVGGDFTTAGGVPAKSIAQWDGHVWFAVGDGPDECCSSAASAMAVFDDGGGPSLYVGGCFAAAGTVTANGIARWDGQSWSSLGTGLGQREGYAPCVAAMTVLDRGAGPALYIGGGFRSAGGVSALGIARWDGDTWSALEGPRGAGADGPIYALAVHDDGRGSALYVGGRFTSVEDVAANRIAKWDGQVWSPLGSGVDSGVSALAIFDDGTGPALYAGGYFTTAGNVAASGIAKWNGALWSPLGAGVGGTSPGVRVLAVGNDGGGPALYAGGHFTTAGTVPARHVAKWDGTSWSALSAGLRGFVDALAVFDDGSGPALYAGTSSGVFQWDGSIWRSVPDWLPEGSVPDPPVPDDVFDLDVIDDGTGPALYAGWNRGLSKWDGHEWSEVMPHRLNPYVFAVVVYDDDSGPALYAGGAFGSLDGVWVSGISRWDGCSWSPLQGGFDDAVYDLAVFDDGTGPALYAGGSFWEAGDTLSYYIAKWYRPSDCLATPNYPGPSGRSKAHP